MSLEDKILSGYAYRIESKNPQSGERITSINTGRGGILLYIKACRDINIPEEMIAQSIICYTDQGPYTMDRLTVTKKDNNETTTADSEELL